MFFLSLIQINIPLASRTVRGRNGVNDSFSVHVSPGDLKPTLGNGGKSPVGGRSLRSGAVVVLGNNVPLISGGVFQVLG